VATLCIAARIDSAVFVLPILLASPVSWMAKRRMLVVIVVGGACYAAVNVAIFGIAFPISGSVKSLGGFHINLALIHQVAWKIADGSTLKVLASYRICWLGWMWIVFSMMSLMTSGRSRRLSIAFFAGLSLFLVKISLFSSWAIWYWYTYPVLIGFVILAMIFLQESDGESGRMLRPDHLLMPVSLIFAFATLLTIRDGVMLANDFVTRPDARAVEGGGLSRINERAAAFLIRHTNGARVAMGDRAGSLAYFYPGGVVQLEGLVNDVEYLGLLAGGADPTEFLCKRGAKYLLSYQPKLGAYEVISIPVFLLTSTDYTNIPRIKVSARNEVGEVYDLDLYQNHAAHRADDNILYIWKLPCDMNLPL
jgi:hypothetical protein